MSLVLAMSVVGLIGGVILLSLLIRERRRQKEIECEIEAKLFGPLRRRGFVD